MAFTNLSLTINDLSIGDGLLDVSCSGLLSSPDTSTTKDDHDQTICSCHGDHDTSGTCKSNPNCVAPTTPNIEISRGGAGGEGVLVSSQNMGSVVPTNGSDVDPSYNAEDIHSPTLPETRKKDEGMISLFNDTSATLSRFLNRDHAFQDKMNETSLGSSYRLSFADSTQFYSLAAGNLQDCLDEEDDDTAVEDNDNEEAHGLVVNGNSVVSINTSQRNVTFRTKSALIEQNEHNEFLNSNGDINASKFHDQAINIEENIGKRDRMLKHLYDALELTVKEKEEKDFENQALIEQITELQALLSKQVEDETARKRENLSPTTETYSSHSELPNSEIEDLKLQVANLEKKLEVDRNYLEGQTAERELERDDFQRTITDLTVKIDDMKKEKDRFDILISNQKTEIEDYEVRLRDLMDVQNEAISRNEKVDFELKSAVEKIHELREIIRDLEEQIDGATKNVCDLKVENQLLNEEREKLESLQPKTDEVIQTTEEIGISSNADLTDELHAQVEDLTRRLERKLNDMDNFQWSTRPNSSCSNAVSVSNEDISVGRDLGYINRDKDCVPHDIVTLLSDGLRKLDAQFESLVRFEEIIMKKLRDSELRLSNTHKIQEDLENEKLALHDKIKAQIMTISDLENRLDQFRFEPSPNAVTLSGLRARVTSLTNEITECKGQLQLKEIEMQDLTNKLTSKEALVSKLSMQPPPPKLPPPIKKYSISIQTDSAQPEPSIKKQSAFTQTIENKHESIPMFKIPKSTNSIAVQTKISYTLESDSMDISRIHGTGPVPVTHSTPNDPVSLLKHSSRNLRHKLSQEEKSSKETFASPFEVDRSPEVLRDPVESRLNHSFASDKIPRIPDLNEYNSSPSAYLKAESDYNGGSGGIAGRFNKMKDVEDRSVGTSTGTKSTRTGGTNTSPDNGSSGGNWTRETGTTGETSTSSASDPTAIDQNGVPISMRKGGSTGSNGREGGDNTGPPTGPDGRSASPGPQSQAGKSCFGLDTDLMDQVKCFLQELNTNASLRSNLCQNHYNLIQAVMQFLVKKEEECIKGGMSRNSSPGASSDDECGGTYEVVTVTDFAWNQEDQQLSILKTQGKIVALEKDKSRCHIQAGGTVVRVGDMSNQAPADQRDGNGELEDRGCDAEPGPVGTTNLDWERMEKSKQGRQTETASKIESETLKTQMCMLQQALAQEKEKNSNLVCDLDRMSRKSAGSGDLCAEFKYENDQQRNEINTLLSRIQTLESQNAGAVGYNPMAGQQQQLHSTATCQNLTPEYLRASEEHDGSYAHLDLRPSAIGLVRLEEDVSTSLHDHMTRYGVASNEKEPIKSHSQRWFELYLRAKSYRKALAWQKKYLTIVIQGYKDLLATSSSAFEHPDLLQKQVPITPSSVGLCDRRKGKTRFRIVGKAVLASVRMKYMVNRWRGKICPKSAPDIQSVLPYSGSSRNASASSSSSSEGDPNDNPRKVQSRKVKFVAMSPPTKENWSKKASRSAPHRTVKPLEFSTDKNNSQPIGSNHQRNRCVPNTEAEQPERQRLGQGSTTADRNNSEVYDGLLAKSSQLSQYFERFHSLEKEIGNTLLRGAHAPTTLPNNSKENEVKK